MTTFAIPLKKNSAVFNAQTQIFEFHIYLEVLVYSDFIPQLVWNTCILIKTILNLTK